jgi:hypothetical protein
MDRDLRGVQYDARMDPVIYGLPHRPAGYIK